MSKLCKDLCAGALACQIRMSFTSTTDWRWYMQIFIAGIMISGYRVFSLRVPLFMIF